MRVGGFLPAALAVRLLGRETGRLLGTEQHAKRLFQAEAPKYFIRLI